MHVGIALLLDEASHNQMRDLAFELDRRYGLGLDAAALPPHVSLKQPFACHDLGAMSTFFSAFAATIPPFSLTLTTVDVLPPAAGAAGIVWFGVQETPHLRQLHERLNAELAASFRNTDAPFDGPTYRFHATVTVAQAPATVWSAIQAGYAGRQVDQRCAVRSIGLFYGPEPPQHPHHWISYRILPLAADHSAGAL